MLSALASGVVGALGTSLQAQRNKDAAKYEAELNEQAAENAFFRTNQLYDKDYQLHTYKAMREQMEEAGLSPGLIYGKGGSAGIGGGSTGNAAQGGASVNGVGMNAMQIMSPRDLAGADLAEAQADYYRSMTKDKENWISVFDTLAKIKENEAIGTDLKNRFQEIINRYQGVISDADATKAQQEITHMAAEIEQLQEKMHLTQKEQAYVDSMRKLVEAQTTTEGERQNYFQTGSQYNEARTRTENAIRMYKVANEDKKGMLMDAEKKEAENRAKMVDKRIEQIGKEMNLTDTQIWEIKDARAEAWMRFGVDLGKTISQEAREWVNTFADSAVAASKAARR